MARKVRAVADAGFDGLATLLTPEIRALAEKNGLKHLVGFISSSDPADFERFIREQKECGAVQINVQMDDHDTPPKIAVQHWVRLERTAEKIGGVSVSLEIHRDTCTETPEKTYEIAERYEKISGRRIRFTFDFSHLAVVKHLNPSDFASRLLDHPELVQHAEQIHFRPFNGHHCQVPVTFKGKLSPEVIHYLGFAQAVLKLWKNAPENRDAQLFACPEMGPLPSGYNVSGFPPSWTDAVILQRELSKAWKRV